MFKSDKLRQMEKIPLTTIQVQIYDLRDLEKLEEIKRVFNEKASSKAILRLVRHFKISFESFEENNEK